MNNHSLTVSILRTVEEESIINTKKRTLSYSFVIIVFGFLVLGFLFDSIALRIFGCLLYFALLLVSDVNLAMELLIVFAPSMAIITYSNNGIGLYGFGYFLVLFKVISKKSVRLPLLALFSAIILLIIGASRIVTNLNIYDFSIFCEVICAVFVWILFYKLNTRANYRSLYNAFLFGCVLLFVNISIAVITGNCLMTRWCALNDDPNYTGCTLCVLLMCALLVFCYKIPSKTNIVIMIASSLFGLMTGSRGFLLAVAFGLSIFVIASLFGNKEKRVTVLILFAFLVLVALYFMRVGFVVNIYETTIGRTLSLSTGYEASVYMDITSGRSFLWIYYWNMAKSNNTILFFGKGFYNYHLIENGGYGQVAHNAYISSIIGLGLTGTFALFVLYFSLIRHNFYLNRNREHWVFLSVIIVIIVELFFLDGILDSRLVIFFATFINLFHIYLDSARNKLGYVFNN